MPWEALVEFDSGADSKSETVSINSDLLALTRVVIGLGRNGGKGQCMWHACGMVLCGDVGE